MARGICRCNQIRIAEHIQTVLISVVEQAYIHRYIYNTRTENNNSTAITAGLLMCMLTHDSSVCVRVRACVRACVCAGGWVAAAYCSTLLSVLLQ